MLTTPVFPHTLCPNLDGPLIQQTEIWALFQQDLKSFVENNYSTKHFQALLWHLILQLNKIKDADNDARCIRNCAFLTRIVIQSFVESGAMNRSSTIFVDEHDESTINNNNNNNDYDDNDDNNKRGGEKKRDLGSFSYNDFLQSGDLDLSQFIKTSTQNKEDNGNSNSGIYIYIYIYICTYTYS